MKIEERLEMCKKDIERNKENKDMLKCILCDLEIDLEYVEELQNKYEELIEDVEEQIKQKGSDGK